MPTLDPRIDAYIEKAAPFAQPILRHIRAVVHEAEPTIEETIKWGMPHFTHRGRIVCHMASFKAHCALGFWGGDQVVDDVEPGRVSAMGQFGRIASPDDLPPREALARYVRRAVELREGEAAATKEARSAGAKPGANMGVNMGVKTTAKRSARPEIPVPGAMAAALAANDAARAQFERFSPSARREYVEWVAEAKTDATRDRRIAQMLEWVAEGKPRNWKYMKR